MPSRFSALTETAGAIPIDLDERAQLARSRSMRQLGRSAIHQMRMAASVALVSVKVTASEWQTRTIDLGSEWLADVGFTWPLTVNSGATTYFGIRCFRRRVFLCNHRHRSERVREPNAGSRKSICIAWELWHGVSMMKMQRFDNPPPGNEFGRLTARVVKRLLDRPVPVQSEAELDKYRIRQALDMSPPDGKQFVANAADFGAARP